ncbi:MAG: hypothetical protein H6739_20290 [Alphaproteobacteria bacterium]|nr:hypothetical protein [Alphaproteobacteria bacterium]
MHHLRARAARLALLLGVALWVFGLTARHVHRVQVMHVVCAVHGEILEMDAQASADDAHTGTDELRTAPDDPHDHDCALQGVSAAGLAQLTLALPAPTNHQRVPRLGARAHGIRGPPLAYAPKTSPPLSC